MCVFNVISRNNSAKSLFYILYTYNNMKTFLINFFTLTAFCENFADARSKEIQITKLSSNFEQETLHKIALKVATPNCVFASNYFKSH